MSSQQIKLIYSVYKINIRTPCINSKMLEIAYLPTYYHFYSYFYCLSSPGGLGFNCVYLVRNYLSLVL